MTTNYFLFAGEVSGDLHGSRLMRALRVQDPTACLSGVGGTYMRQEELECDLAMENFQVMGFSDVFKALPRLWKLFYQVRDLILKKKPDYVILIDYPGFNLRLARELRKQGFTGKIVQYICPSIWAHGKKRIHTLTTYYDLLLTIYPFEAAYFSQTALKVTYIGHPVAETIRTHAYQPEWMAQLGLLPTQDLIALFPGSRAGEIQRHVPQQLQVAAQLKESHPHLRFALSCAQPALHIQLMHFIQQGPLRLNEDLFIVPPLYHYELMKTCKTALAKSGTVTLELALHQVPTVVHYELSRLNYFIANYFLRLQLSHYCIVNLLRNQTVFPEFIGKKTPLIQLKNKVELLHFDENQRQHIQQACEIIQQQLGNQSSHACAAQAIQELRKC